MEIKMSKDKKMIKGIIMRDIERESILWDITFMLEHNYTVDYLEVVEESFKELIQEEKIRLRHHQIDYGFATFGYEVVKNETE